MYPLYGRYPPFYGHFHGALKPRQECGEFCFTWWAKIGHHWWALAIREKIGQLGNCNEDLWEWFPWLALEIHECFCLGVSIWKSKNFSYLSIESTIWWMIFPLKPPFYSVSSTPWPWWPFLQVLQLELLDLMWKSGSASCISLARSLGRLRLTQKTAS